MSLLDEMFFVLAAATGGAAPVCGHVVDEIGTPVVGATIRAVGTGPFDGRELARTHSDTGGAFELHGAFPAEFAVVAERGCARTRLVVRDHPADVGELQLLTPFRITGSVGDGGDNRPYDVRRLQDRLHRLGRLSDDDVAAEPVNLAAPPPVPPGPRTLAALTTHLAARLGRRPPAIRVDPGSIWAHALAELPPFPTANLGLKKPVGVLPGTDSAGGNAPAAVALIQDRLFQLGLLRPADRAAEAADPALVTPLNPAVLPQTVAAIVALEHGMAGSSLRAIIPGTAGEKLLHDPHWYGRRPLMLAGSVGERGRNLRDDVCAVQDRLLLLGYLSSADHVAERPPHAATGAVQASVPDTALPRTIAALRELRERRIGEPAPAPGLVDPIDPALHKLEWPPRLVLADTVGDASSITAANIPADVRHIQDRLLLLGLLSRSNYDAERVDPLVNGRIEQGDIPHTTAALSLATTLRGRFVLTASVGRGGTNFVADVRAVQDRCCALGLLAEADFQREQVEPEIGGVADETALASTFRAIELLREQLFGLPPALPDQPWTAHAEIIPGDETEAMLQDPLFFGRRPLGLQASVGTRGWNFPTDVRAVQDRLRSMRLLSAVEYRTEVVDPRRPGRVADTAIPATREAIGRLRRSLLAEAGPIAERVEVRSPALAALDDRLGALRCRLDIEGSVGWGGRNVQADVLRLLERLHGLGLLANEDYIIETATVRARKPGEAVRDADFPQGIAAIAAWQQLALGATVKPVVEPLSETQRSLERPDLPRRVSFSLTDSVGRKGANLAADVRKIQDRLFELGELSAEDYFAERVNPATSGSIPEASLPATIASILHFQQTVAGNASLPPDGLVGVGRHTHRTLEDPTHATPTAPNPSCVLASAGPARPTFPSGPLARIVLAIEASEGGKASGETPAVLRNASGTPASWGRAQVIGGTCLERLKANPSFARFYGLEPARVAALADVAAMAGNHFDRIESLIARGMSEHALQAAIAADLSANGSTVRTQCGLGSEDIARMFRTIQLRHHLRALGETQATSSLLDAKAHPDSAANIAALGLSLTDLATLRAMPYASEHRSGFVTRALFNAPEGQAIRNALTDDSGVKLGRLVIQWNWGQTDGLGLDDRQRAMLTAYLHNRGGNPAELAAQWPTVAGNEYVSKVIDTFDRLS